MGSQGRRRCSGELNPGSDGSGCPSKGHLLPLPLPDLNTSLGVTCAHNSVPALRAHDSHPGHQPHQQMSHHQALCSSLSLSIRVSTGHTNDSCAKALVSLIPMSPALPHPRLTCPSPPEPWACILLAPRYPLPDSSHAWPPEAERQSDPTTMTRESPPTQFSYKPRCSLFLMARSLYLSPFPLMWLLWLVFLVGLRTWRRAYPPSAISSPLSLNSIKHLFGLLLCKENPTLRSPKLVLDGRRRAAAGGPKGKHRQTIPGRLSGPLSYRFTERKHSSATHLTAAHILLVPLQRWASQVGAVQRDLRR